MFQLFTYGFWRRCGKAVILVLAAASPLAAEERLEILALGDSLVHGYGLPPEDGFVPQMQAWLDARGHDVTLVNGGVSGDTTAGGLARVEWSLTPETDAIIVALGGNDLLRGIDPGVARANLDGILKIAAERDLATLLVPMLAPGNYGADYKTAFDSMYPDLAADYGALEAPGFFEILMQGGTDPNVAKGLMQGDGIHPNAKGVARIVAGMGPHLETLIERVR